MIQAIQYKQKGNEVINFLKSCCRQGFVWKYELESESAYIAGKGPPIFSLVFETEKGIKKVFKNDWIIKDDESFYVCSDKIFKNALSQIKQAGIEVGKHTGIL